MSLTKQVVSISELFRAPSIDIKNKVCRLLEERLWCSGHKAHKKYLLCKRRIIVPSLPFAQVIYGPQSLVPGIWQNPLPLTLTGPPHSHSVDTKHKTMKSVKRIV